MGNETEKVSALRFTEEGKSSIDETIVTESPLTIIVNNQELVTLLCTPSKLKYLAIGFLVSEGLVKDKNDIKNILVDDRRGIVRVETGEQEEPDKDVMFKRFITSGCGRGASFYNAADVQNQTKVDSQTSISTHDIMVLMNEFQHHSLLFKDTGGVHSAALCEKNNILIFSEDIGRHNAIDKIFGECFLENIATDNRSIVTSGRVSSEILLKIAKRNIPLLISKSAPTSMGVKLADDLGITLVGFARGKRMNVYTNSWRIVTNGK